MKAIIVEDINSVRDADIKKPLPGTDECLLKVDFCGVCKTDVKIIINGHRDLLLPRIPGHECCAHAEDGSNFVIWPGKACGICELCKSGRENLCPEMKITGFHRDGCMAEYVVIPEKSLIPIPVDFPQKLATFAEPLACCLNALEQFSKTSGNLLIAGGGTCGLLMALAAEATGFSPAVFEPNAEKIKKADNCAKFANIKITSELSEGRQFDYAVNATPAIAAILPGMESLKTNGEYCIFSGLDSTLNISASFLNQVHYLQLTVKGAYGCTKVQMENALFIINKNRQAVECLIEKIIKLENVKDVLEQIATGKSYRYIIAL